MKNEEEMTVTTVYNSRMNHCCPWLMSVALTQLKVCACEVLQKVNAERVASELTKPVG